MSWDKGGAARGYGASSDQIVNKPLQSVRLNCQRAFAFPTPSSLAYIAPDVLAYEIGTGVHFVHQNTNESLIYWSKEVNLTLLAVNAKRSIFAYTSNSRNPAIHVVQYPSMDVIATLDGGVELGYTGLAFSRDGTYLAALGDVPDHELAVWVWEENRVLAKISTADSAGRVAGSRLSFNPANKHMLCTSGSGFLSFWHIDEQYESFVLREVRAEPPEQGDVPMTYAFSTHTWAPNDIVYAGCIEGELLAYDVRTGAPLVETSIALREDPLEPGPAITALAVTKTHVLVADASGHVKWYVHGEYHMTFVLRLPEAGLASLVIEPTTFKRLVLGTKEGVVRVVDLLKDIASVHMNADDDNATALDNVDLSDLGDFHAGPVTGVACFPRSSRMITTGHDGTLRLWDTTARRCHAKVQFPSALTGLSLTRRGDLAAVGSESGVLRIFALESMGLTDPKLVFRSRLFKNGVSHCSWNEDGSFLLVTSVTGVLYWIQRREGHSIPFRCVGTFDLRARVTDISWNPTRTNLVFVALEHGDVIRMAPPHAPDGAIDDKTFQLTSRGLELAIMKVEFPCTGLSVVPRQRPDTKYYKLYGVGTDKKVKQFTNPADSGDPELIDDENITPPDFELDGLDKQATALCASRGGHWLLAAGRDGKVVLRSVAEIEQCRMVRCHNVAAGGASSVAWRTDDAAIVSCGSDGSIFVWDLKSTDGKDLSRKEVEESKLGLGPFEASAAVDHIVDAEKDDDPTYVERRQREIKDAEDIVHKAAQNKLHEAVQNLKDKFRDILMKNEVVPELERLDRDEFVIDYAARDAIVAEGEAEVAAARKRMERENLAAELICDRIKTECWDKMEVQGKAVKAFVSGEHVNNYSLRKLSEAEQAHMRMIKTLRRAELYEFNNPDAPPKALGVVETADAGDVADEDENEEAARLEEERARAEAEERARAEAAAKAAEGAAGAGDDDEDVDGGEDGAAAKDGAAAASAALNADDDDDDDDDGQEEEADGVDLLYDPLELYTKQRKVAQIALSKCIIHDRKVAFNERFDEFTTSKAVEMEKLEQKTNRLEQIIKDLKIGDSVFKPELDDDEVPERVLTVDDSEVKVERVLSKAEQEALDARRKAEEEARFGQKGDDSAERALRIMMGGRLHEETDADRYDEEIAAPDFYHTVDKADWSDEQKKAAVDYEKEVQTRKEEREKHRKALETEMKKLQAQVQEMCKAFDDRLAELLQERFRTDQAIYEMELSIIQLSRSLLREENDDRKEAQLLADLEVYKLSKGKTAGLLTEFKREVDQFREEHESMVLEDKALDKTFRREFVDEELFDILLRLYKRRQRQAQRQAGNDDAQGSLDPFAQADIDPSQQQAPVDILDPILDMPEGLSDAVWDRLVEARQRKIASEQAIRKHASVLQNMQQYLATLTDEDEAARVKIEDLYQELNEFREERLKLAANLEKLFRLKQGQVEVEQEAVVTDYADAVLLNRTIIEALNKKIRELGGDKVKVLEEVKDQRKAIHLLDWENQKFHMQGEDLQQKMRDFQLLRVTKSLQELIKGGGKHKHAAEIAMLEKKSEHSKKVHEEKVNERKGKLAKLKKLIREKEADNRKLDEHIANLEVSVSERSNIYELQTHTATGGIQNAPYDRFKDIVRQRKLLDLAKAQTEEIEFLRDELERLKQRTFPSFAIAQGPGPIHPDEQL